MVIRVYTSGISGNKEVKKRQQRIMMILESKCIDYEAIDITEPGREPDKQFMQDHATARDSKHPLPPQIFNEDDYCGDYVGFDLANENDELEVFLKMPLPPPPAQPVQVQPPQVQPPPPPVVNGQPHPADKELSEPALPERNELNNSTVLNSNELDPKTQKPVHGYCFTPSLAQRLARAIEKAYVKVREEEKQTDLDSETALSGDKDEEGSDSSLKDAAEEEGATEAEGETQNGNTNTNQSPSHKDSAPEEDEEEQ